MDAAGEEGVRVEAQFRRLAPHPTYANRFKEHRAMLYGVNGIQIAGAPERSLFLDSAACTLIDLFAEMSPEPKVKRCLHDRAALSAWAAVVRARNNRIPPESLRQWFIFGEDRSFVIAILRDETQLIQAMKPFVGDAAYRVLERTEPGRLRDDVDAVVAEALRGDLLECRRVVTGPERVLAYLEALAVEETNIRLCCAAVVGDMNRDVVVGRLRMEYV